MSGYATDPNDHSVVYFYIDTDKVMFLKANGSYDVLSLTDLKPVAAATWATLAGKPATFPPNIGTTADTAKAGNYTPAYSEVKDADLGARAAMRTKPEIAALTAAAGGLDLTAILGKLNAVIAALKA